MSAVNTYSSNTTKTVVKVGFPIQQGFSIKDDNGNYGGYNYELLMKLSQYADLEFKFTVIEASDLTEISSNAMDMLMSGEIDMLGGINYMQELAPLVEYTTVPSGINKNTIVVLDSSTYIDNNSYKNDGFKIALNSNVNSTANDDLFKFAELNDMNPEITYASSQAECIDLLYSGKVDAILSKEISENYHFLNLADFSNEPFYYIATKGNTNITREIDKALSKLMIDDPYILDNLKLKYFTTNHSEKIHFSTTDRRFLDSIGDISVGFVKGSEPYASYNSITGEVSGITVDILKEIEEILGINFTYEVYDTAQEIFEAIVVGEIDMLGVSSDNYENASTGGIVISNSYSVSNSAKLTLENLNEDDIEEPVSLYHYVISKEIGKNTFDDFVKGLEMLNDGEVDYIYADPFIAQYYVSKKNYSNIVIEQHNQISSNTCFAVSKNSDKQIIHFINHAILHIPSETIDEIILANSYVVRDISLNNLIEDNPYIVIQIVIVLAVILSSIVILMQQTKRKALYMLINQDQLTNAMTKYSFINEAENILKNAKEDEYILISVDVDNFQYVNEVHGYDYGSTVLQNLSKQLMTFFPKGTLVAREKDDTFLVLTKNLRGGMSKLVYLENIAKGVTNIAGIDIKVNTSQGVYFIVNPKETLTHMIDCTHSARLLGKISYNNSITEFTTDMLKKREVKKRIVSKMETALANFEFHVFYQVKVNLDTFQTAGAEALVRWIPDDGKMFYPDDFIPLFESNGFIVKLDYYVFERVCEFIAEHEKNTAIPKISVNLSTVTLLEDDLVERLVEISKKYKIQNKSIELEITESAMANNFNEIIAKTNALREMDFTVSMDDFGAGISSLNHLKDISIDVLKIDKEFISDSLYEDKGVCIVKSIIAMSRELNLLTVAEGVETKEHINMLRSLGCDIAQGYYFSKPINQDGFLDIIRTPNRFVEA